MLAYDAVLAGTSLWVLYAARFVPDRPLLFSMVLLAAVSLFRHLHVRSAFLQRGDRCIATLVFVWVAARACREGAYPALACALLSAASFAALFRFQCRRNFLCCGDPLLLLPHLAFRFFAFWMVMFCHGQPFSWGMSSLYAASSILLFWAVH